jgi:hypothetical protein
MNRRNTLLIEFKGNHHGNILKDLPDLCQHYLRGAFWHSVDSHVCYENEREGELMEATFQNFYCCVCKFWKEVMLPTK